MTDRVALAVIVVPVVILLALSIWRERDFLDDYLSVSDHRHLLRSLGRAVRGGYDPDPANLANQGDNDARQAR